MKFSSAFQLKLFIIMIIFGIALGILYGTLNIINNIKEHIITHIICDLIFTIFSTISFIFMINMINMGEIRAYLIIGASLGFIIERITLGKIFAKGYKNVYNLLKLTINKLTNSKIGRIIFK